MAALMTALQITLPTDMVPDWMDGPLVMFCMLGATGVTGLMAMTEPFNQILSALWSLDIFTCMASLLPMIKAASGPLGMRFTRIFYRRSRIKAQSIVHAEKAEKLGHQEHPIVYKICVICDHQFDQDQGILCCGILHEKPVIDQHTTDAIVSKTVGMHLPGNITAEKNPEEPLPPHFTCSGCLAGHIRNMLDEGGLWHTANAIPCSVGFTLLLSDDPFCARIEDVKTSLCLCPGLTSVSVSVSGTGSGPVSGPVGLR